MPVARHIARAAAVAFVVGLSMGAPNSGVAAADSPDTDTASHATDTGSPSAGRPARGPKAAGRGSGRDHSPAPAATEPSPPRARAAKPELPSPEESEAAPSARPPVDESQPQQIAEPDPAPSTRTDPEPGPLVSTVANPVLSPVVSIAPPAALLPQQHLRTAPAARAVATPRGLAAVGIPAGSASASSFTDVLDGLLGPIQAVFEGAALMVRRSLFNEAPTVHPVQLTGLSTGPITGTLGAVDPEGDSLAYTIGSGPTYGTVAVGADGSYTYTPGPGFTGADSFTVTVTDTGLHINLLDLFRPAGTDSTVAVAQSANATPMLHFQFIYGTGSQYWSPQARSALETAAARLGSYIVVTQPVVITYSVTGQNSLFSSTLANAGSDFLAGEGFLPTVVQSKIQTGYDANGSAADGSIDWNFAPPWAYGDSVGLAQYDFQSIAMHEILHTLGFISFTDAPGSNTGRVWTMYDEYLTNSAGKKVISSDYVWNTAYNPNLTGGNGGLYFSGPNAVAANHGPVPLHTPNPWASGSSVSHLRDGSRQTLMEAVISSGADVRTLSPVELAILRDIGYRVAPSSSSPAIVV